MGACQNNKKNQKIITSGKKTTDDIKKSSAELPPTNKIANEATAAVEQKVKSVQPEVAKLPQSAVQPEITNLVKSVQPEVVQQLKPSEILPQLNQETAKTNEIEISRAKKPQTSENLYPNRESRNFIVNFIYKQKSLLEAKYPSFFLFDKVWADLKPKLQSDTEVEHLVFTYEDSVNATQIIPFQINKALVAILPLSVPENQTININMSIAGLQLASNIRKAYSECTTVGIPIIASDQKPFELITFTHSKLKINPDSTPIETKRFSREVSDVLGIFNEFSAFCNGKDKLYISGGEGKKAGSGNINFNTFVEIDLLTNEFRKLPDLLNARSWHSMIFVPPKYVFIVGGQNTKSVELYDIESNQITNEPDLQESRFESTLAVVNDSYLYAFYGFIINQSYNNSVERCDLRYKNRKWEKVDVQAINFTVNPSFFSAVYGQDNALILIGGSESQKLLGNDYIFELKNGKNFIKKFNVNNLNDTYICSEKFFIPIDEISSILLPSIVSDSESLKVLQFDSDNKDNPLKMMEFNIEQTQEDQDKFNY